MSPLLVFATHNAHKLEEVQAMMGDGFLLKSLTDIGFDVDIAETGSTFQANAQLKSKAIFDRFGFNCFADDSGLVVDALNGEPGIYSARYSGSRDPKTNLELVLQKMEGQQQRSARFVSVISLILEGEHYFFEGRVEGSIIEKPTGLAGFGYDPIFIPDGYDLTFAEMEAAEKNRISHRALAMQQMLDFLKQHS
jgi:XTP/dITP diphosphohydrolase